ncbi:metallophosphoesterase [Actinokineospora inagensis]|uniref:metallophosphoesterase n=1 Tax=Actinokineospora inagensis TaxID=103730 RepID=UPI0003F79C84|nr:metallophosphoesterase [Actinokineospora inagensis]
MAEPVRPRPTALTEAELGFAPQRAVRWLAPRVLITTGVQSLLAEIFGSYSDKREVQGGLAVREHDHRDAEWIDFVADLGDGFDATYTVAQLLAAEELAVDGHTLPRGRVLVMGGDEVYPFASTVAYEDRTKGVYRAALPHTDDEPPVLFALPGNHDWYDGLTAFIRVFAQGHPIGGWTTEQTRSYFAIRLPHNWWLLAIDTQFDEYVDAPQLAYFREATKDMAEGDGVILCTPSPEWVRAGSGGDTRGYDTIEFFDREIVRAKGAQIRLMLSGDTHHYARFTERDSTNPRQRITCGIGGAYLAATHKLPDSLRLPPPTSRVRNASPTTDYDLEHRYPDTSTSEKLAAGIPRLPWRNPGFWGLAGIFQTVMTLAVLYGLVQSDIGVKHFFGLVASWAPAVIVGVVLVISALTFARLGHQRRVGLARFFGLLHAAGHIGLSVGWSYLVIWLYTDVFPDGAAQDWGTFAVVALGTPTVIGFIDAEVVAGYLLLSSRAGINLNEVMAGQSIEDYKGFLRLRVDPDGITIYPIRVDRIGGGWTPQAAGPWFRPETPLDPHLIEAPVRVSR